MRLPKLLLPLLFTAILPLAARAWGVDGHRAIGLIAAQRLSPKARQAVAALLSTQTLALVSTQPDEMRYLPEFKETAPWHYVNSPAGLAHDAYVTALKAQPEVNAYNILLVKIKELRDPALSREQRARALIFVVHIVGDVHQPLHAGHAEDKGGNDVKLTYRGKETNLHSLWDSGLIEYLGLTYTELGQQLNSTIPAPLAKTWQSADPTEWLYESYAAADKLYVEAAQNPAPDYRYFPAQADLLKLRLQQAGVRLAAVLNEAFK